MNSCARGARPKNLYEEGGRGDEPHRLALTLKEQVIYGRVFKNLAEVRNAVAEFVELYNDQWLIEKNGYQSPLQARGVCNGVREAA
jgi:Integrase core domain